MPQVPELLLPDLLLELFGEDSRGLILGNRAASREELLVRQLRLCLAPLGELLDVPVLLSGGGDLGAHIPVTINVSPLSARVDRGLLKLRHDPFMLAISYLAVINMKGVTSRRAYLRCGAGLTCSSRTIAC